MSVHVLHRPGSPARRAQIRSRRAVRRLLLSTATTVAMLVAVWWLVAPPGLGGTTSVAVVDGTSMLPRFRHGDLVLVRRPDSYRVGDVVAYRSRFLRRIVLHRIVEISGGHYTFKGDNNSWADPERPSKTQLIGKQWIRVPGGGRVAEQLRRPIVAAALAALVVLALGSGGRRSPPAASER